MYCKVCVSLLESKALVELIHTAFQTMGYTLIDDQDSDPGGANEFVNGYRVYKLSPVNVDQPSTFIKVTYGTSAPDPNYVYFDYFLNWDAVAHTGSYGTGRTLRLYTSAASAYFGYAYVYEDKFFFSTYVNGSWYYILGGYVDVTMKPHCHIVNPASTGSSVWVDVDTVLGVERGMELFIWGNENALINPEKVKILDIDDVNNKLLIENLPIDVSSNHYIGFWCHGFLWLSDYYDHICSLYYVNSTSHLPMLGTHVTYGEAVKYPIWFDDYDPYAEAYPLAPIFFKPNYDNRGVEMVGYWSKDILKCKSVTEEDAFYISKYYEGSVSGATSTTLSDSTQSWGTDELAGKVVVITSGKGYGQTRVIASNTATELTVNTAWDDTPDTTSTYMIVEEVYRFFKGFAFKEEI